MNVKVNVDESTTIDPIIEQAWGIIANAGGGDWTRESEEWQEAAARFRDAYHERLAADRNDA